MERAQSKLNLILLILSVIEGGTELPEAAALTSVDDSNALCSADQTSTDGLPEDLGAGTCTLISKRYG